MTGTMTRKTGHRSRRSAPPEPAVGMGTVEQAMSTDVVPVTADTLVGDALVLLDGYGVTCGPVVNRSGRVVGLVTRTALERRLGLVTMRTGPFLRPRRGEVGWCVADMMTQSGIVTSLDEPLANAIVKMAEADVDRIAVVDADGRPLGVLSNSDLIKAVARWIKADAGGRQEHLEGRTVLVPD